MHPVIYPVPAWLHDHHLGGRAIVPAVESMRIMARALADLHPAWRPNCVLDARFLRLIAVDRQERELEFFLELEEGAETTRLALWRRLAVKGMRRSLLCADLFVRREETRAGQPPEPLAAKRVVAASRLYRELVPFGPAFQSLEGELWLAGDRAGGTVRALRIGEGAGQGADWLGSPFPLDGAMHVACVHGQERANFVPFPVAFRRRRIHVPTRPGERYRVLARLCRQEADSLEYDLWLMSETGLCEELQGLVMRDVSAGRLKPPAWWQASAKSGGADR